MAETLALIASNASNQKVLEELTLLEIKDLGSIENAAESFTNQSSGDNKTAFITTTYDVKLELSNLSKSDRHLHLTGLTAKATTQEMGETFTVAYGIFKINKTKMTD